ncbi:transmembrane protein sting [Augochlora pura]
MIHFIDEKSFTATSIKDHIVMAVSLNTLYMFVDLSVRSFQTISTNSSSMNTKNILKSVFNMDIFMIIFIIQLIVFMIISVDAHKFFFKKIQNNTLMCIGWSLFSILFIKLIHWFDTSKQINFYIDALQGLDYGTGMAYSYYYGYLKLILPSTGTSKKGLLEKIENFEDHHNVSMSSHKLLILIPSSTYIPPDLKEISYQWMESAVELEEDVRDRAGVKRRRYHNNVYKIYPNGIRSNIPKYVVAEGATPLMTFFEVQKHAHPETNVYKTYREHIINKFYQKLKDLIDNDPECKDLCDIIYYKDYDDKSKKVNVAKVILEKLNQTDDINS